MNKRSQKLDTFIKHSGYDGTFILVVSVGISALIVHLFCSMLGMPTTGELTVLGGLRFVLGFLLALNIWTVYYNIKNEDCERDY